MKRFIRQRQAFLGGLVAASLLLTTARAQNTDGGLAFASDQPTADGESSPPVVFATDDQLQNSVRLPAPLGAANNPSGLRDAPLPPGLSNLSIGPARYARQESRSPTAGAIALELGGAAADPTAQGPTGATREGSNGQRFDPALRTASYDERQQRATRQAMSRQGLQLRGNAINRQRFASGKQKKKSMLDGLLGFFSGKNEPEPTPPPAAARSPQYAAAKRSTEMRPASKNPSQRNATPEGFSLFSRSGPKPTSPTAATQSGGLLQAAAYPAMATRNGQVQRTALTTPATTPATPRQLPPAPPTPQQSRIGPQPTAVSTPQVAQARAPRAAPPATFEQPVAETPTTLSHAARLVVAAKELASTAETDEEYTRIVETCRRALAVESTGTVADYAKQLASWALNRRGQLKADAGRNNEALLDFEDALRLDPNRWRALHNRGVLFAQAGEFEDAFDDFNNTCQLNPRFAKAYSNRAALFVQAGDMHAALKDYRRAISLDPNLAVAHKGRGRVCHVLGSLDEALHHYDAAAQLEPTDAHILASRADLLCDLGRYTDAAAEYQQAVQLDPKLAHAQRSIAWLLATCPNDMVRNADEALEHAQAAVEIDGTDHHVNLDTLAAAQANAGDFAAAIETIEAAIEVAPETEKSVYAERLDLYRKSEPFRISPILPVRQVGYEE